MLHSLHNKDQSLRIKLATGKVDIHDLVVMEVVSRDALGRPKDLRVLHGDEQIKVREGLEFITVWVSRPVMAAKTGRE